MKKILISMLALLFAGQVASAQTTIPDKGGINVPNGITTTTLAASGKITASGGVISRLAVDNVNDTTPTLAEMTTACGSMTAGEYCVINDNNANAISFIVWTTDGTTRFFLKGTKGS